MAQRPDSVAASKPIVFGLALVPLGLLIWRAWQGGLGTDPVAQLEHGTGIWALRLLLATLCITPLRVLTGWNKIIRYRRMLGCSHSFMPPCI